MKVITAIVIKIVDFVFIPINKLIKNKTDNDIIVGFVNIFLYNPFFSFDTL